MRQAIFASVFLADALSAETGPGSRYALAIIGFSFLIGALIVFGLQSRRSHVPRGGDRSSLGHAAALQQRLTQAALWLSIAAGVLPTVALVGWLFSIPQLVSLFPGTVGMNPVVAVCLVIACFSLRMAAKRALRRWRRERNSRWALVQRALAALIVLVGLIKVIALATHQDWPIDRLLFPGRLDLVQGLPPNRMAPNTALSLITLGLALLLIDLTTRRGRRPTEALALAAATTALIALIGYFYRISSFYSVMHFYSMSLPTAFVVMALAVGTLFARSARGMMSILTGDSVGGITARRLIPMAVILPIALGWLRLLLIHNDLVEEEFATALLVVANIVFFTAVIWSTSTLLHRADVHRQESERQLRQGEERYRAVVEQAAEGIYMIDADTHLIVDANIALKQLLGYDASEDVNGRPIYELVADDPAGIDARIARVLTADGPVKLERQYTRVDGQPVDVEISASHFEHNGRRLICTVVHDITERKRAEAQRKAAEEARLLVVEELRRKNQQLEESARSQLAATKAAQLANDDLQKAQGQLVQSEKLIGLGQMVAGVAHEINNPLAFVVNNVAVLQRDVGALRELIEMYRGLDPDIALAKPEAAAEIADFAERLDLTYTLGNLDELMLRSRDGLKRIQQIVRDLRDFARLDEADVHEVDLNDGIASTLNIIRGRAKKKQVTLDADLAPLPLVMCAPGKINQVVMNLVANAIDACNEHGHVSVSSFLDGQCVKIRVRDDGSGIPADIRQRIFDPFFTTKPLGEGTGLGLSISYGIVQEHGGAIAVDSAPGAGTTFVVTLPVHASIAPKPARPSNVTQIAEPSPLAPNP